MKEERDALYRLFLKDMQEHPMSERAQFALGQTMQTLIQELTLLSKPNNNDPP